MNDDQIPQNAIDAIRTLALHATNELARHLQPDAYYSDSAVDEITMTHDILNLLIDAFNHDDRERACTSLCLALASDDVTELNDLNISHPFHDDYLISDALGILPPLT